MRSPLIHAILTCAAAAHAQSLEVLIVSDAPAPFVGPDIQFVSMSVDATGLPDRMVIHGTLSGPGITAANEEGVWVGPPGDLHEVFRRGGEAPGHPGSVIRDIGAFGVNWPQTYLSARFFDGAGNRLILWTGPSGDLVPLVEANAPAPGLGSDVLVTEYTLRRPSKSGLSVVEAEVSGPGIAAGTRAVWHGLPGALELIGIDGGPAPAMRPGVTLAQIFNAQIHDDGTPFYEVRLEGDGITTDNNNAHMYGAPGEEQFLVREDDPAPALPGRLLDFPSASWPAQVEFTGSGPVKVHYGLDEALASGATPTTTWAGAPDALEVVLAGGQAAPGLEPGVRIAFVSNSSISEAGYIGIGARIEGPGITTQNDQVAYFGRAGSLAPMARTGDSPPGFGPEFVWNSLTFSDAVPGPGGVCVINGNLTGPGVTSDNDQLLVVFDAEGEVVFTFRKGTSIEVAPGESRITTNPLGVSWTEDGRLVLNPMFTDGTEGWIVVDMGLGACQADCDGSGELDFFDFLCFQNLFAAGDPEADCDDSGALDFFDFLCFQDLYAAGCP